MGGAYDAHVMAVNYEAYEVKCTAVFLEIEQLNDTKLSAFNNGYLTRTKYYEVFCIKTHLPTWSAHIPISY